MEVGLRGNFLSTKTCDTAAFDVYTRYLVYTSNAANVPCESKIYLTFHRYFVNVHIL